MSRRHIALQHATYLDIHLSCILSDQGGNQNGEIAQELANLVPATYRLHSNSIAEQVHLPYLLCDGHSHEYDDACA